jgi:SulP family sulfate permease
MPAGEIIVMVVTVAGTLATHNLAVGVVLGVLAAMVVFARRVAHFTEVSKDGNTYSVRGELFFASSNDLVHQFDYANDPDHVVIDMSGAHIWDASSVAALDAVNTRYAARGKHVEMFLIGG